MATVKVFLTSGTSYNIPADWNNASNSVETIGAGGGGAAGTVAGGGGGGGAYSKATNITASGTITIQVGTGGSGSTGAVNGVDGGDTWFNGASLAASSVGSKGGSGGIFNSTGGAGGLSASGVGSTKFNGGTGGARNSVAPAGGGGGGAAGLNGVGNTGGTPNNSGIGGSGGSGDIGSGGAGGSEGSGGNPATVGGNGTEYDATHGSGGGGGGGNSSSTGNGASGGFYGAGGGGGYTAKTGGSGIGGLIYIQYNPPSRYWVGGTGNWDAADTTHWSSTSGGAGGFDVPTSAENVFFDANSGGGVCTISATANTKDLTMTGYTGTLAGSSSLNVLGSLALATGMTFTYTGILSMVATATGKTFTTAGKTLTCPLVFNGVGGGWTLTSALTSTGTSITLTNGSFNSGNFNISTPLFLSSNSNTRSLILGSSTISLTGTGSVWDLSTSTGMTLTANTSIIQLTNTSSSGKTFAGGSLTYRNLLMTGSSTGIYTISGSNTFNDFSVVNPPHTVNFTAGTTQTVTTFTVNGTAGNLMTLQSTVSGSDWSLASASVISCDYLSLQDSRAVSL